MTDRQQIFDTVTAQIEPFNKKGVALTDATTFQGDLEWDSLTVMDFVAAIEDEFDIIITMNMQAEIETVGQLVDAVAEAEGADAMTDAGQTTEKLPADPAAVAPERDLMSKFDALIAERQALIDTGVTDPFAIVMEQVKSPTEAVIAGKRDDPARHLQLHGHDVRPRRDRRRARTRSTSSGRAPTAAGCSTAPSATIWRSRRRCATSTASTGAIVFSTGYMANLGMISTLAGKGEYVILDADSHASIYDGCKQGNAEIVRFRHNSVEDLDKRLGRLPQGAGQAGRARRRLFDARRHRAAQGNGRGRQEARRDGAERRSAFDGLLTAPTAAACTRSRAARPMSISSSAPSPSRSAPSAASACRTIRSSRRSASPAAPISSPPACRRRSSRPPRRRSAS